MKPSDEKFAKRLEREREMAKEALQKMGYRKTRDGWIVVDRFDQLHKAGLAMIIDKRIHMTIKGQPYGYGSIMAYLTGNKDSL